jgi:CheY-like chemotaxis protein
MANVLIVDASQLMLRNMLALLSPHGFNLQLANSGMQALSLLTRHRPDVIVLDAYLPGANGENFTRLLRSNPSTADIPIILTAGEERMPRSFAEFGAQALLVKPLDMEVLAKLIKGFVDPMPHEKQAIKFLLLEQPEDLTVEVAKVKPHEVQIRSLELPSLRGGENVILSYGADAGIVARDATVQSTQEDLVLLSLGPKVIIKQQRRFFRREIDLPLRYRIPGDFFRLARTLDISAGGLRAVGMGGALELGMMLDFQLVIDPAMQLNIRGAIRRLDPGGEGVMAGIEFREMDPRVQAELTMFLFNGSRLVTPPLKTLP